jgi:hypothetical protein
MGGCQRSRNEKVFAIMALRIFQPNRDEVAQDWQKLHNDKLYNLYSLLNTIRMIMPIRMRWERHVVFMAEECIQNLRWKT